MAATTAAASSALLSPRRRVAASRFRSPLSVRIVSYEGFAIDARLVVRSRLLLTFSLLLAQRCVLGSEQLRVVEGKRMCGSEPWGAKWMAKAPSPAPRLAALPPETRDSTMKIFSGTANRPLSQVRLLNLFAPYWLLSH
jgi:hypothetical protein